MGENWKDGAAYRRPSGFQTRGNGASHQGEANEFHFGGTGFSDFFEQMFSRHGRSGFSPGENGSATPDSIPGSDIEGDILVTLNEVVNGATREISLQSTDSLTGQAKTSHLKVRIPAGIHEGQRIRVAGKGGEALGHALPGDLYLRVRLAAHPDFRVRGSDLYYDLEVAPWEAVLGTSVKVPTLKGQANLRIPSTTNNDRQFRIPGHGLPKGKNAGNGDIYVVVDVRLPKTITEEERHLWEKLASISPFKPRSET